MPRRRPAAGAVRTRLRNTLVVGQVALSLALLVSAALFLRGLARANDVDPGFSLRDGVIAAIDLLPNGFDEARGTALHARLLEEVSALSGVEAASLAHAMPLDITGGSQTTLDIPGYAPAPGEELEAGYNRVGPGYFETMGIRILAGRAVGAQDADGRPLVAVINETMARRYWPGQDPVGRSFDFGAGPTRIVGVAADGKYGTLQEAPRNFLYVPLAQFFRHDALLVVRTAGDPEAVVPMLHATLKGIDPNLPLFDVRTVEEHRSMAALVPRIGGTVLGVFGGLALLLAVTGLYSVVAGAVTLRTREIGVRVALGATRGSIVRLVVQQGVRLTAAGIAIGAALSAAAAFALRSQLMGVAPIDPLSFGATTVLLGGVALLACLVPALRAARLDPVRALRRD